MTSQIEGSDGRCKAKQRDLDQIVSGGLLNTIRQHFQNWCKDAHSSMQWKRDLRNMSSHLQRDIGVHDYHHAENQNRASEVRHLML